MKLAPGDQLRVIAPALSLKVVSEENRKLAIQRLEALGFHVTFGAHVEECNPASSSSKSSRIADLHAAFADPDVKAILTVLGGFNSNGLLDLLDYDLIRNNAKIFCGYSDITALQNALFAKSGLITFSGPHFSTFACQKGIESVIEMFVAITSGFGPVEWVPSQQWSDDAWYLDQVNRHFFPNEGHVVIQEGAATGQIIGGNLCTLNLLQGTAYFPKVKAPILFIEDDHESKPHHFDRDLESLLQAVGPLSGLVIGRFEKASQMSMVTLRRIIADKNLGDIPMLANVDFGHTLPLYTIPIGGKARIENNRLWVSC